MTSAGDLSITASADLGALGSKTGTPVIYKWVPPSLMPKLLPWLGLLLLLLPKRNRCASVLWISLPLIFSVSVGTLLSAFPEMKSQEIEIFSQIISATAFGIAAAWLLLPYLNNRVRFLSFLSMLAVMEVYGASVCLISADWNEDALFPALLISVTILAMVLSLALSLAKWNSRQNFGGLHFLLWLNAWILLGWALAVSVISLVQGSFPPFGEAIIVLLLACSVTFGLLLPFLILSFVNPFYRDRFMEFLDVAKPAPSPALPPVIS